MLMYTKNRVSLSVFFACHIRLCKADTGKEHTEDDAWIRANIGTIQHAMLSEPNMGSRGGNSGVVRAARRKNDLDARAGIVWKEQSGNSIRRNRDGGGLISFCGGCLVLRFDQGIGGGVLSLFVGVEGG